MGVGVDIYLVKGVPVLSRDRAGTPGGDRQLWAGASADRLQGLRARGGEYECEVMEALSKAISAPVEAISVD